jgi:hypothetical protein
MMRKSGGLSAGARACAGMDIGRLMGVFGPWVDADALLGSGRRERLYTPARVFWLFLSQVLSPDGACREAVQKFLAWLAFSEGREASPNTCAYCGARQRLPAGKLREARDGLAEKVESAAPSAWRWHGRPVKVVDGSGLSMPDTPENQKEYPQSKGRKKACGFPEMRIVALFSLATGVLLQYAKGSRKVAERTLFRRLWNALEAGDVLLADRGFCSLADYHLLLRRGVDLVMRLHQRRAAGVRMVGKLGRGDTLAEWTKSKIRPRWLTPKRWAAIPGAVRVRHITFSVDIKGFRTARITVATTLLDPREFPASHFADLYRRRWAVELYFRDIKTSLGMDILRCQTPEMIEKELIMHVIAYNLIRATMLQAAAAEGRDIARISFKGTCQTLREWAPVLALAPARDRQRLVQAMLKAIARDPLPFRPDRTEPRATKRRPKNYQLLNKPRRQFKECPHRNRYTKTQEALS